MFTDMGKYLKYQMHVVSNINFPHLFFPLFIIYSLIVEEKITQNISLSYISLECPFLPGNVFKYNIQWILSNLVLMFLNKISLLQFFIKIIFFHESTVSLFTCLLSFLHLLIGYSLPRGIVSQIGISKSHAWCQGKCFQILP